MLLLMLLLCYLWLLLLLLDSWIPAFVTAVVVADVALKNPAAVLSMSKDPRYFIKLTIPAVAGLLFLHGKN